MVLLSTPAFSISFYRNDLPAVISSGLTTLFLPAVLFATLVAFAPHSPWAEPVGER